jgi:hypothetical protein
MSAVWTTLSGSGRENIAFPPIAILLIPLATCALAQLKFAFLAGHVGNTDVRSNFFARTVACRFSPNPGENDRDVKTSDNQAGHYH